MSNKVSMAQFEDFPQTSRRHYGAAAQDKLGPGLAPKDEAKSVPVSLARTRQAHDTSELRPNDPSSASPAPASTSSPSPMMSSYQAMQAGLSLEDKKRTGKKILTPPGSNPGPALFLGGATPGLRTEPTAALALGTTKQSSHIPGYGGHIPKTATPTDPVPTRPTDKTLIIENFKPYGPGYTGRKC